MPKDVRVEAEAGIATVVCRRRLKARSRHRRDVELLKEGTVVGHHQLTEEAQTTTEVLGHRALLRQVGLITEGVGEGRLEATRVVIARGEGEVPIDTEVTIDPVLCRRRIQEVHAPSAVEAPERGFVERIIQVVLKLCEQLTIGIIGRLVGVLLREVREGAVAGILRRRAVHRQRIRGEELPLLVVGELEGPRETLTCRLHHDPRLIAIAEREAVAHILVPPVGTDRVGV